MYRIIFPASGVTAQLTCHMRRWTDPDPVHLVSNAHIRDPRRCGTESQSSLLLIPQSTVFYGHVQFDCCIRRQEPKFIHRVLSIARSILLKSSVLCGLASSTFIIDTNESSCSGERTPVVEAPYPVKRNAVCRNEMTSSSRILKPDTLPDLQASDARLIRKLRKQHVKLGRNDHRIRFHPHPEFVFANFADCAILSTSAPSKEYDDG
ncbi:uncharacterized protein LOC134205883 [Armigeres subalbatus]|uniref:uncharacterized protein LOC134205883 n=1 Tax=Armigeres subalbatus TaxID=124917 RepID=UPI002ED34367